MTTQTKSTLTSYPIKFGHQGVFGAIANTTIDSLGGEIMATAIIIFTSKPQLFCQIYSHKLTIMMFLEYTMVVKHDA